MSNYTKQISWSGKDALSDSDPEKVISGGDFDTEFSAVQTAINSKIDDIVDDTTPQLGGDLDFQTHKATSFTSTGIDDNATGTKLTISDTTITGVGAFTSTSIDATKLSGDLPAIDGSALTGLLDSAFFAYQSADTTLVDSTATKVLLNTASINVGSYFDTANKKFLPLKAGYYHIDIQLTLSPDGAHVGNFSTYLYKNGAAYVFNDTHRAASGRISGALSTVVYMNGTTDYLELYAYRETALNQNAHSASSTTFMSGHYLGV